MLEQVGQSLDLVFVVTFIQYDYPALGLPVLGVLVREKAIELAR